MKLFPATLASAILLATAGVTTSAAAQDTAATTAASAKVVVGSEVFDRDGTSIGTIKSVDAAAAIIAMGDKEIGIPLASFGSNERGLLLGATLAELQAALAAQAADAAAKLEAALVAGASVHSLNGTSIVGTIKGIENDIVLLTTDKGQFGFPKSAFYLPAHGLSIAYTAEQFDKTIADAAAGAGAAPAAS